MHWHPFFTSAYAGGGFTLGAGYATHVGSYNTIDFRGSWTPSGYLRAETEFIAPRLFDRRGRLSAVAGWRKATQVGFYGTGTRETSADDRANYSFEQPYASATLDVRPWRRYLVLTGGAEYSRWDQGPGEGNKPSVEEIYTPDTLPGLDEQVTYLHARGTAAFDSRTSEGYTRRGGYYGVTFNNFLDQDDRYSFKRVDYEVIQHVPILRETWVLSVHGRVETTSTRDGNEVPFFMLPALGGGSSLRGYASWRFRDLNSVLVQAEWRVIVNNFLETAIFYDAGKVEARAQDLDLNGLKSNFGIGVRLHGPAATPVRIELAKGNEGLALVFAASASF
jgi:outer membrane protein assembly factor BamA